MLAYAARRPVATARQSSPNAMLLIIVAHIAAVALVMSAKMDLPRRVFDPPTEVDLIPVPQDPPPNPAPAPQSDSHPDDRELSNPTQQVPIPDPGLSDHALASTEGAVAGTGGFGPVADTLPLVQPTPPVINLAAQLLTAGADLKPPYPTAKEASGEEANLVLRLTIDERGRVVAVEPVGRADRAFFDAGRRHLLAHWRFRPASEGGRPVVSSTVINLRFQLEG
ncbi:MAG: energy transducer TonB [Sphingomicrobium sp.]